MIEINLLPKQYQKRGVSLSFGKTGLYVIAAVAGVLLMLAGITVYQQHQLSRLDDNILKAQQRARMLQKDIQLVDGLIDVKQKINERMTAVERLDSHRSNWVRILETMSGTVPEFVWLARFSEKAETAKEDTTVKTPTHQVMIRPVEIEGYTFTLNALASYMINMMRSHYFDKVELTATSEKLFGEQKAYNFVVSCYLHYLSDEEMQDMIATANRPAEDSESATSHQSLN